MSGGTVSEHVRSREVRARRLAAVLLAVTAGLFVLTVSAERGEHRDADSRSGEVDAHGAEGGAGGEGGESGEGEVRGVDLAKVGRQLGDSRGGLALLAVALALGHAVAAGAAAVAAVTRR